MIICDSRRIYDREIVRHARAGMGFDDIQFELGVATQCSATCPIANLSLTVDLAQGPSWNILAA